MTIKAVAYYRMSSDKQEASIPDQREAVEAYAERNGYKIIREYADEGISGDRTDKRVAFQEMISDSASGKFAAVLCWDQDRFGRFDSLEAGHWIFPLRQAGVHLATVTQGKIDWNDFAGRMMYGIMQEGKHQYLRDLSRNVQRGMRQLAATGKRVSGAAPVGYVKDSEGRLEIDEAYAPVVRRIYRDYLAGCSLRGIVEQLQMEGVKTPRGKNWSQEGVRYTLTNEAYYGAYVWNKRAESKYGAIRGGVAGAAPTLQVKNDPEDWIVHEDAHPAIVTREDFELVRQRLVERRVDNTPHKHADKGGFALTGIARCAQCGARMVGEHIGKYTYYTCSGYRMYGSGHCLRNAVRQDEVLTHVLGSIEQTCMSPLVVKRLRESLRKEVEKRGTKSNRKQLETKLARVVSKLDSAKQRLLKVDDDMIGIVQDQIRELDAERAAVELQILDASKPVGDAVAVAEGRIDAAMRLFSDMSEAFKSSNNQRLRNFLKEAIERVDVEVRSVRPKKRRKYFLEGGTIYLKVDKISPEILDM